MSRISVSKNGDSEYIAQYLLGLLPHGMGINGNWHITQIKRYEPLHVFTASNYYEAMNESGMYCHIYDFSITYKFNKWFNTECKYCHSTGKRTVLEMSLIRGEDIEITRKFLHKDTHLQWIANGVFTCNVCDGKGYTYNPLFEIIRFNFHGQKEYSCCGYGLKDYLEEICTLDENWGNTKFVQLD